MLQKAFGIGTSGGTAQNSVGIKTQRNLFARNIYLAEKNLLLRSFWRENTIREYSCMKKGKRSGFCDETHWILRRNAVDFVTKRSGFCDETQWIL